VGHRVTLYKTIK